ncbi:conserved hypothetical protein [Leishmania mexicana MHOM/GT/2001/U1103]|uniref:Uncharacterized protein n=1 Tax=Leishmania mexicana (strain MHOM/GT/2001/U1103) TaxID=929439 RepID=E9AU24_LEIMU|nr:conserved hypothetical protein [Leishmania mexicana MHOM/GT/2001/U1103]CBZ26449.1 conserved hypothetical protein [Leishmania mexicana MHOM/GT/2001/U1103]
MGGSTDDDAGEDHVNERDYIVETLAAAPYSVLSDASGNSSISLLPGLKGPAMPLPIQPSVSKRQERAHAVHLHEESPQQQSSARELASLTKVLSILSAILQRSRRAHQRSRNFGRLLTLLTDGRFAATAAAHMQTLWLRCSGHASSLGAQASEEAALSLYCDVLLLVAYHARMADASGTGVSSFVAAEEVLASLYAVNRDMGAELVRAAAHHPAYLRRSVASLTAFCILQAGRLSHKVLEDALQNLELGAAARANMAHMAFMAALPTSCPQMTPTWQCRALEVVRKATLYDAAADVFSCTDGGGAVSVIRQISTWVHGYAMASLLSVMSEAAWCYCTTDALLHISRAVSVYGATWTAYLESYMNLVSFLHRALTRYERSYAQEESMALRMPAASVPKSILTGSSSATLPANRQVGWHSARSAELSVESLMRRAVLGAAGVDKGTSVSGSQGGPESSAYSDFHLSGDFSEGDGTLNNGDDSPEFFLARCEAETDSPRSFVFYLSLLAYVTSALPPLLGSLGELRLFFYLPHSSRSAAAANCADSARDAEATDPPAAASGTGRHLFALCMDLLRASLASTLAHCTDKSNLLDRQKHLLCESATTLLCAFMCRFPHSLQRLEAETGATHLVGLVNQVVTTIIKAPRPSLRMKRLAYSLLQRYASAVESFGDIMAQLLAPSHWTALRLDDEYVEADLRGCVQLYQHLCRTVYQLSPAEPGHLLSLLAELPAGTFSCSSDGAATATTLVHTIFTLMEDHSEDVAVFGEVTVPQLPQLIGRLVEALDTLANAYAKGDWVAGGESTWCSVCATASLLYKAVLLYHAPALVATTVFPARWGPQGRGSGDSVIAEVSQGGGDRRSRSGVHVLLQLLCEDSLAPVHHVVAELLVAALHATALHRTSESMLWTFRSHLSPCEVVMVTQRMLQVQRDSLGSPSNAMRVEVVQAMAMWCPALFLFLFGPEKRVLGKDDDASEVAAQGQSSGDDDHSGSGGVNRAAAQPADLPLMQLLMATVRSDKAALYEKALALNILRYSGMSRLVEVQEILSLMPREDSNATRTNTGRDGGEWEEATLAVACVAYVNARVALELSRSRQASSALDNAGGGEVDGSNRPTASARESTPAPPPQQRRSTLAPPSPFAAATARPLQAARSKVLAAYTDIMDQLLRHGAAAMQRVRSLFDAERCDVDYDKQTSWLVRQATSMMLGENPDVSASVVFPRSGATTASRRLAGGSSRDSIHTFLHGASQGSVLNRGVVPTALAAATAARAHGEVMNPTTFLQSLSSENVEVVAAYQRLFPVGTASTRFFRGTGDDRRLNNLAAELDTMADLATALEQLLWLSAIDTSTAGLFGKRTQQLLECAVESVLSCQPGSPLLASFLTRQVQRQLRLAQATASILETAVGGDATELFEMNPTAQHSLRRLVAFAKAHRGHVFVLEGVLLVVTAFPLTTFAACAAVEELMAMVQAALHAKLRQSSWTPETLDALDKLVNGCTRVFSRPRSDGGSDAVLVSRLLPTLLQVASRLARFVQPTQPSNADTLRFVRVLECVNCVIAHYGGQTAVLGFADEDVLLGFLQAIGQFSASSVYDTAAQRHLRLAWNVCWLALLSLWCTIMSVRGQYNAIASGWAPSLKAALLSSPRFAAALSAFAGDRGGDRGGLHLWEVEEVDACTRLAAVLAAQNVLLEKLTPCVQAGFVFLRQPHLHQQCVVTVPSAEAVISEGRRITIAQASVLRNELTILLKQASYAVPRDGATLAAFVFPLELLGQTAELASGPNLTDDAVAAASTAASLVYSLDLLRQFTVRELQVLRRVTAATAPGGAGLERSPNVGYTNFASRESSVTLSPSRGPLVGDADTVTDVDDSCTVDGQGDVATDVQSVHLETVQLALTAYALTVQDLIQNASRAPGMLYTAAVLKGVQHSTERLVRTLRSLVKDLSEVRWPLLSRVVQGQTARLQHLIECL